MSCKMRETMLVGGELSSRSPHYEGSERDDSVKVVKRGSDPFWWRELKQRHDGCLMNWKWRYRDHPCRSQNLPQNICNYYINNFWTQQLVAESEADEDQTGTNSLKLCFALPTRISPVRCWDKLLLRRFNPCQTATLDHYKSHPQIFVAICNFEDYKTFLSLSTAEIGVIFFFVLQHIPFGFQSSAASTPSSFQTWSSALLLKNHSMGQGSVWSLSWRELSIYFSTL